MIDGSRRRMPTVHWLATGLGAAALLVAAGSVAEAQMREDEAGVLECARVGDDGQRLACYDALAQRLEAAPPEASVPKWNTSVGVSKMDDSPSVYLTLEADTAVYDLVVEYVKPVLWLQCVEGHTSAFINWGFIIGGPEKTFTWRLDDGEANTTRLEVSRDFQSIGSWQDEAVIEAIKEMTGHDKFTVRTTNMNEEPLEVEFDIRGLREAVEPLRQACGW